MRKSIRIATLGVAIDYRQSLLPRLIEHLGYSIQWCSLIRADLVIIGPIYSSYVYATAKKLLNHALIPTLGRHKVTLFHTAENRRYDEIKTTFSISFDLAVSVQNHLRMPYWMDLVDWTHEGIATTHNPRFGQSISLQRLMQPLGRKFLEKPRKAALFASHMNEPRPTLYQAVSACCQVQGFGRAFDNSINSNLASNFSKHQTLKDFAFNLCPENSLYPGYYTEKIPEAFQADSLPLTWVDNNVTVDFNPAAFINLAPMMQSNFAELEGMLSSATHLETLASQPLVLEMPTLEPHKKFVQELVKQAVT